MILSLRIHHLALIEDLTIEFGDGLHVMTGETGAGKSIVVDAVNLVLGGRADRDLIRTGTDKAWVEAVFDACGHPQIARLLESQQIEAEDGIVTLYRELTTTGRNLCRVCGTVMPVSFLKEVAACLMDVHGQHEHQFLIDPAKHMEFLDASGSDEHYDLMKAAASAYEEFVVVHRKYARLVKENDQKTRRMEELKKSIAELEKARLKPGEAEALTRERDRLRHFEKTTQALQTAYGIISAGGEESALLPKIKEAADALSTLSSLGEPYASLAARCESAYYALEEIGYELADTLESGEFDPNRAEAVEHRLDLIRRLERKYDGTAEEIIARLQDMREEFERYSGMDAEVEKLEKESRRLLAAYRAAARALTESRRKTAEIFEQKMMEQLRDLGMEKTVFRVSFAVPTGKLPAPRITGDDNLEFMISPNPGEPLKPLGKIASGGELSRLMLALKTLEAEKGGVGTMVFDEIDTGISGRMAQVVAEKMAVIARNRQVICVTHLPQLSAMADHQFLVAKAVTDGRTNTGVRTLNMEERISEVARMLGGAGDIDASARAHAAHMIEIAQEMKQN